MSAINDDILSVLLKKDEIDAQVKQLGEQISRDFDGRNPLLIGVLKGSFVFMSDLIRNIDVPCSVDFMAVSSYGNRHTSSGTVQIAMDLAVDVDKRHVIIVEDILDSGLTLNYLSQYIRNRNPLSISIVTLLDKPGRRQAPITPDYVGFEIPDAFVVGYGLDFAEKYRNLPYIGILKPEIYATAFGE